MVGIVAMIGIGSIEYGPEISRRPISKSIQQLNRALAKSSRRNVVEIVFVVPGTLGKADFDGFNLRRRTGNQPVVVFVAVSADLAADTEPIPGVIDLARSALSAIPPGVSFVGDNVGIDELTSALDDAAEQLSPGTSSNRGKDSWRRRARVADGGNLREGAGIQVHIPVHDRRTVDKAFELESALEEQLNKDDAGYVDGTEVGEGEFTIFAYGPDVARLRESVSSILRGRWRRPGVVLQVFDGEDEIEEVQI